MDLTILEILVGNPANPKVMHRRVSRRFRGNLFRRSRQDPEKLGIKPIAEQTFRLADGSKITRKKGVAIFKYGKQTGGADVIFGEEGDSMLLGDFTLEALGLALDPLKRELRPLPMILAGHTRSHSEHGS